MEVELQNDSKRESEKKKTLYGKPHIPLFLSNHNTFI